MRIEIYKHKLELFEIWWTNTMGSRMKGSKCLAKKAWKAGWNTLEAIKGVRTADGLLVCELNPLEYVYWVRSKCLWVSSTKVKNLIGLSDFKWNTVYTTRQALEQHIKAKERLDF